MIRNFIEVCRKPTLAIILISMTLSCATISSNESKDSGSKVLKSQLLLVYDYLARGQASKALPIARTALMDHPNDDHANSLAGLTHLALKNKNKALEHLKHAHQLNPTTQHALNLSSAYIQFHQLSDARLILKQILEKKVVDRNYKYTERIFHNLGYSYEVEGEFDLAKKYYTKALEINPLNFLTNHHIGIIYQKKSQHQNAIFHFKTAIRSCPKCSQSIRKLALSIRSTRGNRACTESLAQLPIYSPTPDQIRIMCY